MASTDATRVATQLPTTAVAVAPPAAPFISHVTWRKKCIVVLVGLPARGKSYVATKIVNWLRWRGGTAELFNVGKYRRSHVAEDQSATFFDPNNAAATHTRDALAFAVLDSMLQWLREGGDLAVLDATNTTRKRRADVLARIRAVSNVLPVVFIESICTDPEVLQRNYIAKVTHSPDYQSMPREEALADLKKRIANYEAVYEPIDAEGAPTREDISYIKLINLASKCICNRIHGVLMHSLASFLMSIHVQPRPIYLSRAGVCVGAKDESQTTAAASTPASSVSSEPVLVAYAQDEAASLSEKGREYARRMNAFVGQCVLDYWHTHLVSKRAHNPDSVPTPSGSATTASSSAAASAEASTSSAAATDHTHELSTNAVAGASVFSPPGSTSASPILAATSGSDRSSFGPLTCAPLPPPLASSAPSASPFSSPSPSPMTPSGDNFELAERSTAVIGSGSMTLTLERSKSNDTLPLVVYTSTLPRALQSVQDISERALYVQQQSSLNALDHGTLTGLTLDQLKAQHPNEYAAWLASRYRYRFPGGESQQDKARALESLMMELERQLFPVLIVSHASTLQILLGYFSNLRCEEYACIHVDQHILIELTPSAYGWRERLFDFSDLTQEQPKLLQSTHSIYSHTQNFYAS